MTAGPLNSTCSLPSAAVTNRTPTSPPGTNTLPGVRRAVPGPEPGCRRSGAGAGPAGLCFPHAALVHPHGDLSHAFNHQRVRGHGEFHVGPVRGDRLDGGCFRQVRGSQFPLVGQRDDGVRVAHADRQCGPGHLQAGGFNQRIGAARPGGLRIDKRPRPHVHRVAVGGAEHLLHPAPGADGQRFSRCQADEPLCDQEVDEDAYPVAAHFGERTVRVAVIHEPFGRRLGLQQRPPLGQQPGRNGTNQSIGANSPVSVAQRRHGGSGDLPDPFGIGHQDKVVPGAVALGESQPLERKQGVPIPRLIPRGRRRGYGQGSTGGLGVGRHFLSLRQGARGSL